MPQLEDGSWVMDEDGAVKVATPPKTKANGAAKTPSKAKANGAPPAAKEDPPAAGDEAVARYADVELESLRGALRAIGVDVSHVSSGRTLQAQRRILSNLAADHHIAPEYIKKRFAYDESEHPRDTIGRWSDAEVAAYTYPRSLEGKWVDEKGHPVLRLYEAEQQFNNLGMLLEVNPKIEPRRAMAVAQAAFEVAHQMATNSPAAARALSERHLVLQLVPGRSLWSPTHERDVLANYSKAYNTIQIAAGSILSGTAAKPSFGGFSVGTDFRTVLTHEFGHAIAGRLAMDMPEGQRFYNLYADMTKDEIAKGVSKYAATSISEFTAESIAAYLHPGYGLSKKLPPKIEAPLSAALGSHVRRKYAWEYFDYNEDQHPRDMLGRWADKVATTDPRDMNPQELAALEDIRLLEEDQAYEELYNYPEPDKGFGAGHRDVEANLANKFGLPLSALHAPGIAHDEAAKVNYENGGPLTPEQEAAYQKALAEYNTLPDSSNGRIIATDLARELSPEYSASVEGRSTLVSAVHEPSSSFVRRLYADKVNDPVPEGLAPTVLFTAGGTGAGKTTAIDNDTALKELSSHAALIVDDNMSSFDSSAYKIDHALAEGKAVAVVYVYRDPVDSWVHGAIPRAESSGRVVPMVAASESHKGSFEQQSAFRTKYANDKRVQFAVIDNSLGKGKSQVTTLDAIASKPHEAPVGVLRNELERLHQQGSVSDRVYQGTLGAFYQSQPRAHHARRRNVHRMVRQARERAGGEFERGSEERRQDLTMQDFLSWKVSEAVRPLVEEIKTLQAQLKPASGILFSSSNEGEARKEAARLAAQGKKVKVVRRE